MGRVRETKKDDSGLLWGAGFAEFPDYLNFEPSAAHKVGMQGLKDAGVEYDLDLWPELWMQVNAEAYGQDMDPLEFDREARRHQAGHPLRHEDGK